MSRQALGNFIWKHLEAEAGFVTSTGYVLLAEINWATELAHGLLAVGTGAISVIVAWFIKFFLDKHIKGIDHKKKTTTE
jgi:hypothetical protein